MTNASGSLAVLRERYGERYRWLLLLSVMVGTMASIMSSTIVNVAIPDMSHYFALGQERAQWVTSGFMVATTVSMLTTPWLLSRYGYRATYVGAMLLLLFGGVGGGLARDFGLVLAARVAEGLAAGVVQPIPAVITLYAFQPHEQGRNHRANQLAAQQHPQDDGADRQPLNPAIGAHQLRGRQQLGQDAVLGRGIRRRPQAHDGVGQQRMRPPQHQQAAQHLDGVADQHDPPFGHGIGKRPDKRGQHHVKQGKHGHQSRLLPLVRPRTAQKCDRGNEQGIVGQRAEKLRRHDGIETALHAIQNH